jgi:hypothetical protein
MRFEDERKNDSDERGVWRSECSPDFLALASLYWRAVRQYQFAAKASRLDVIVKVDAAMEGLPV